MPNATEIEKIAVSFGEQYGVDISKIQADAKSLLAIINRSDARSGVDSRELLSNSVTCNADCAVIPDLETFDANEVSSDSRIIPNRVEQSLDEAARYTEICLQIRKQYGEMSKARNDTRFKFEEFFRLDLVHQEEVKAGLYELPLHQALAELDALKEGIKSANSQISAIEALSGEGDQQPPSGVLSSTAEAEFLRASAAIARATANDSKDNIETWSAVTTRRRTDLDHATWAQSKLAASGSLAQQNARLNAAAEKVQYLDKDVRFRIHRSEISRQLAWLQVSEHARKGSAINFDERLANLKVLFDANLQFLVQRILPLRGGLKTYYGIDTPDLVASKGGMLDEIAVWLVRAQDTLSKFKRLQRSVLWSRTTETPIALRPDAADQTGMFEVEFVFSTASLPGGRALLRGVAFEIIGTYNRPITLSVTAPPDATPFCNSPVIFGRVGAFTPGFDIKAQHTELFWNGSASGSWKATGSIAKGHGSIDAVFIHLWLSVE